jgi:putative membrane protein
MKTLRTLMLVALTILSLQACKKDNDENYTIDNQSFVTQASSSNTFEIQAGAIATQKAQNAAVKHYGEHMTTDHTAVGNEMKSLAAAKGWTIPAALQPKEQANLDKLNNTDPSSFDREFMKIMVASHQDAITLFSNAAGDMGVYDADLRSFAGAKLPSLKTHLEEAVNLQAQIK